MPPNGAAGSDTAPRLRPDHAGLDAFADGETAAQVLGVDVGGQAHLGVVGDVDHLVGVVERDDRRHRTEDLVAGDLVTRAHVAEHGRLVEVAGPVDGATARGDRGAVIGGGGDQFVDRLDGLGVDHRTTRDAVVESAADTHIGHRCGEHPGELVGHRLVDEEAVRGGAGLGRVAHLRHHRTLHGGVEVGVVEHDERCVAAEFHHGLEHPVGGALEQHDADLGRAGERHHARRRMVDRSVEPLSRRQRRHDVDHAGGQPGLVEEFADPQRRQRGLPRRLDDRCVAGGEGRGELPGDHRRREVPRGHDDHDADRRVVDDDPVGARGCDAERPLDAHGLFGVPAEELSGVGDLAPRVGERLAVFERDQPGEFVGVIDHQLPGAPEDLAALAGRRRGPGRLRRRGRFAGGGGVVGGAGRDGGDHLLVRRVLDIEPLRRRAVSPLATDQQLGLHTHIMHPERTADRRRPSVTRSVGSDVTSSVRRRRSRRRRSHDESPSRRHRRP